MSHPVTHDQAVCSVHPADPGCTLHLTFASGEKPRAEDQPSLDDAVLRAAQWADYLTSQGWMDDPDPSA